MRVYFEPCVRASRRTCPVVPRFLAAILLASVAFGLGTASAATGNGLVGEHHLALALGGDVADDSFEPLRVNLRYNRPVNAGLDLTLEATREADLGFDELLPSGTPSLDLETKQEFLAGVTWHQPTSAGRVFVHAAIGLARADFGNNHDDGTPYAVAAGIELAPRPWVTIATFVGWKDVAAIKNANGERVDFGVARVGIRTSFAAGQSWSMLADVVIDDDSRWSFAAGLAYRF